MPRICVSKLQSLGSGHVIVNTEAIIEYLATQPVLKMWLFGSYASGEATAESDVGLLRSQDLRAYFLKTKILSSYKA